MVIVVIVDARRLRWRGLVDWRLEVEVWTKSGRRSRRPGRTHRWRAWRIDVARRCMGSHLSRNCARPSCISLMRRSWAPSRSQLSLCRSSMCAWNFSSATHDAFWMARTPSESWLNFTFQPSIMSSNSLFVFVVTL